MDNARRFLVVPSQHTNEPWFQKRRPSDKMPREEIKQRRQARARTALATYLRYVAACTTSYWFIINGIHGHSSSLGHLCGLSELNYAALLVAANLATYTNGRLAVKHTEWVQFISDDLSDGDRIEVTPATKFDLNAYIHGGNQSGSRNSFYTIRIGNKFDGYANNIKGQLDKSKKLLPPPSINKLRSAQRALGREANRPITDALIEEDGLYDAATRDATTRVLPKKKKGVVRGVTTGTTPSKTSTALSVSSSTTAAVTPGPARTFDKDLSTPQEPLSKKAKVSPPDIERAMAFQMPTKANIYPQLSQLFGDDFDASDPKTNKKIRSLMGEIMSLEVDGKYEMRYKNKQGQEQTVVRIPTNSTDDGFNKRAKDWLDLIFQINGAKNNDPSESARRISSHIIKFYKDAHMEACERRDVPICRAMTATAYAALLKATNISGAQERELRKHLQDHLGKNFLPTHTSVSMMCEGHTEVYTDTVKFTYKDGEEEETIEFSWKDISLEVATKIATIMQSKNILPEELKRLLVTLGGDHGGDAFQFGAKVGLHFHGNRKPIYFEVSACEVICRTDCSELLEKTLVEKLTPYIKKMETDTMWVYLDEEQKVQCCYGNKPANIDEDRIKGIHKTWFYVTGDLAFYAMALGRESMSGHWCFLLDILYLR